MLGQNFKSAQRCTNPGCNLAVLAKFCTAHIGTLNMELGNEELYHLHASSNIILVSKSRGMGWVGHVEGKGR
jgi:hypothetical protein